MPPRPPNGRFPARSVPMANPAPIGIAASVACRQPPIPRLRNVVPATSANRARFKVFLCIGSSPCYEHLVIFAGEPDTAAKTPCPRVGARKDSSISSGVRPSHSANHARKQLLQIHNRNVSRGSPGNRPGFRFEPPKSVTHLAQRSGGITVSSPAPPAAST